MLTELPTSRTSPAPSGHENQTVIPGFNSSMTLAMPSTVRTAAPALETPESAEIVGVTAMHSAKAAAMYAAHPKLEEDEEAGRLGHP